MTVAVVDASTVVDLLCGLSAAAGFRRHLSEADAVAAPAHLDAEVLSALGSLKRTGQLTDEAARIAALGSFGARRWPLPAAWALTDRIAVRDALYVALAASLITSDG